MLKLKKIFGGKNSENFEKSEVKYEKGDAFFGKISNNVSRCITGTLAALSFYSVAPKEVLANTNFSNGTSLEKSLGKDDNLGVSVYGGEKDSKLDLKLEKGNAIGDLMNQNAGSIKELVQTGRVTPSISGDSWSIKASGILDTDSAFNNGADDSYLENISIQKIFKPTKNSAIITDFKKDYRLGVTDSSVTGIIKTDRADFYTKYGISDMGTGQNIPKISGVDFENLKGQSVTFGAKSEILGNTEVGGFYQINSISGNINSNDALSGNYLYLDESKKQQVIGGTIGDFTGAVTKTPNYKDTYSLKYKGEGWSSFIESGVDQSRMSYDILENKIDRNSSYYKRIGFLFDLPDTKYTSNSKLTLLADAGQTTNYGFQVATDFDTSGNILRQKDLEKVEKMKVEKKSAQEYKEQLKKEYGEKISSSEEEKIKDQIKNLESKKTSIESELKSMDYENISEMKDKISERISEYTDKIQKGYLNGEQAIAEQNTIKIQAEYIKSIEEKIIQLQNLENQILASESFLSGKDILSLAQAKEIGAIAGNSVNWAYVLGGAVAAGAAAGGGGGGGGGSSAAPESPPVVLDTELPATPTLSINGGAEYTNLTTVNIDITGDTDNVGVTGWYVSESSTVPALGDFVAEPTTATISAGDGLKTLYIWTRDAAGNISLAGTDTITLDTIAPSSMSFIGTTVPDTKEVQYNGIALDLGEDLTGGTLTSLTSSAGGTISGESINGGNIMFNWETPNVMFTDLIAEGKDRAGNDFSITLNVILPNG